MAIWQEKWGSSHQWSRKITGESAHLLGLRGYERGGTDAETFAMKMHMELARSPRSRRTLWSGQAYSSLPSEGDLLSLPLTAATNRKEDAMQFAGTAASSSRCPHEVLLAFERGARAISYTSLEWIVSGKFLVTRVKDEKHPFWGTPITVVRLEEVHLPLAPGIFPRR